MKLEPYVCKCCGGRINAAKMVCEYCDTPYQDSAFKRIKIETVRPGQHTIKAQVAISYDHMSHNPESARDYALHELRKQLADGLLGFMKLETSEDFDGLRQDRCQIIRGTVRVIDPMFSDSY